MMSKKTGSALPTREEIFREKGRNYVPCYTNSCPLKDRCLHAAILPYTQNTSPVIRSINLGFEGAQTEKCMMYRSSEPIRMVVGLSRLYYDMPSHLERSFKHHLIGRYGRKRYYEYHNGSRPLPPGEETFIRHLLKTGGWTEEPQFDGYVEDFEW